MIATHPNPDAEAQRIRDEFEALFKAAMIRLGFSILERFFDWAVAHNRIGRERADEVLADWAAVAECRIVAMGVRP